MGCADGRSSKRREQSQRKASAARARRQQQERLGNALEESQTLQAREAGEEAKRETRVSTDDLRMPRTD